MIGATGTPRCVRRPSGAAYDRSLNEDEGVASSH